jgi:hypothetical protein
MIFFHYFCTIFKNNYYIIGMNEKSIGFADRKMLAITKQARVAVDNERERIFRESGILKPRYEVASQTLLAALAPKQEDAV